MAVGFSGCDLLRDIGIIPDDEPAEEPDPSPEPPSLTKPELIADAANEPSIKAKFVGIDSTGKDGVEDTFNTLHDYIQADGLDDNVIQLGDWIDLEGGLSVAAYGEGGGGFEYTAEQAVDPVTWTVADTTYFPARNKEPRGTRCRLIVVGINSFNGKNDNNTPHVVFQFQNIPVNRRMNSSDTNAGGYRDSGMRKYLAPVEGESGTFLAGLRDAGVPDVVLWVPRWIVSVKNGQEVLQDLLWLPTEGELFEDGQSTYQYNGAPPGSYGPYSVTADETAENQARLEYYTDNESRLKFFAGGETTDITVVCAGWWWEASPFSGSGYAFCFVYYYGNAYLHSAEGPGGCAPAFCVQ